MNKDIQTIENITNPYAKQILVGGSTLIVVILVMFYMPSLSAFQISLAFLLPISLLYGVMLAIRIYQASNAPLPTIPFFTGALFLAGGAAFDGIVTLIKSPTLTREANPIARSLLDSGFSANLVIFHGVVSQIAFVAFICILWAAFLKHKEIFIALVKSKNEQSRWGFLKAAFGGAHLSWRQFLVPYKFSEFPTSYYMVWLVPVCFIGGGLYRWYAGFNWLGFPHFPVALTISITVGVPFISYVFWLLTKYESEPIKNG